MINFMLGAFVGAMIGAIVTILCVMAARSDYK